MTEKTVYVFTIEGGATVDDLLSKFNANVKYPRYMESYKYDFIEDQRAIISKIYNSTLYREYKENALLFKAQHDYLPEMIADLEAFDNWLNSNNEDIYRASIKQYSKNYIDADGNIYNDVNPNAQFNSYEIDDNNCVHGQYVQQTSFDELPAPDACVTPDGLWYDCEGTDNRKFLDVYCSLLNSDNAVFNAVKCYA